MYPLKTFFSSFFLFFASAALAGANEIDLFRSVPNLAQNIRPFDTIGFRYSIETSEDGVTWKTRSKRQVKWDVRNRIFIITETALDWNTDVQNYRQFSNLDGKVTVFGGRIKRDPLFSLEPEKVINGSAQISLFNSSILEQDTVFSFYYYGEESERVSNILFDKRLRDSLIIQEIQNKNEIEIELGYYVFVIDRKLGTISKKISRGWGEDDKPHDNLTYIAENFIDKGGWMFPLRFRCISTPDGGKAVYLSRIMIEKGSLEINEKYTASDFFVKIPAGTLVIDNINKLKFRADRAMNALDAEIVEKQLLLLIERSKKENKK